MPYDQAFHKAAYFYPSYTPYSADIQISDESLIGTYADDTAILVTSGNSLVLASNKLKDQLNIIQKWLSKWRIRVNESKSSHITFKNKKCTCPSVNINSKIIPNSNSVKYLGQHLDTRLTWKVHISKKKN